MENLTPTAFRIITGHRWGQINGDECCSNVQKIKINTIVFHFFFSFIAITYFLFPSRVQAESIQLEPSFQEITLGDQQSVTASIQIHNVGDIVQTFEIFALDIRQQDEQGQIAFVDKPLSGTAFTLASFVQIDENIVTLAPQEQKEIFFQIRNSVDLSPGGHYGAVIARIQNQTETPSEQKILPALSSLLLIHKEGGEQYQLSLAPLDLSKNTLSLSLPAELRLIFSNQGNSHVVPRGVISVTDMFGRLVYKGIINESSLFVLPQSKREVKVKVQPIAYTFPLSFLSIKVEGSSEPGQSHYYQSFSLILIKPKIFMILLLLLVLLLYGAKHIRKSREKSFKKLL